MLPLNKFTLFALAWFVSGVYSLVFMESSGTTPPPFPHFDKLAHCGLFLGHDHDRCAFVALYAAGDGAAVCELTGNLLFAAALFGPARAGGGEPLVVETLWRGSLLPRYCL